MPTTRWFSLRRRLLVLLLGGVTAGWLVMLAAAYSDAHEEIGHLVGHHGRAERHEHDDDDVRAEQIEKIVERLLAPVLFGLPLLGAWIWFVTRRSLKPIDTIAKEIGQRAPEHLEPLVPMTAPSEIRPLLDALNDLFARVGRTLDGERRFTADAAHELRTPLAALATQAQVAQRARDASEREHALAQIVAGSKRAGRLVEQLLTLARLDPAVGLPRDRVDLAALASEVCADHGATALARNVALELDATEDIRVSGNADMLRILLRNLIDNALRYTPTGGRVCVCVTAVSAGVDLSISDSGPGIPRIERESALRRFHRLDGQDSEGSGLGLSIVARIAELHGARLELADGINGTGLTVRLRFS